MEYIKLENIYKIEKERLFNQYERLKKQSQNLNPIQITVKFLEVQSIGFSVNNINYVLSYYENKIKDDRELIDFALEWIRAQKVRLEYKKYLASAQFQYFDLAIDECIFLFFLNYDKKFLRKLFKKDVKEYEISALYEVFFTHGEGNNFNFTNILEKQKNNIPTIFRESERLNTNILTLRSGLSEIIKNDYFKTNIGLEKKKKIKI